MNEPMTTSWRDPFGVHVRELPTTLAERLDAIAAPALAEGYRGSIEASDRYDVARRQVRALVELWDMRAARDRQRQRARAAEHDGLVPAGDEVDEAVDLASSFDRQLQLQAEFALEDGCDQADIDLFAGTAEDRA